MKKLILLKYRVMDGICSLRNNNKGMGTVEIILIIVVLISLVLIFKSQLTNLVDLIFQKITSQANSI